MIKISEVKTPADAVDYIKTRNGLLLDSTLIDRLLEYVEIAYENDGEDCADIANRVSTFLICVERSHQVELLDAMLRSWEN